MIYLHTHTHIYTHADALETSSHKALPRHVPFLPLFEALADVCKCCDQKWTWSTSCPKFNVNWIMLNWTVPKWLKCPIWNLKTQPLWHPWLHPTWWLCARLAARCRPARCRRAPASSEFGGPRGSLNEILFSKLQMVKDSKVFQGILMCPHPTCGPHRNWRTWWRGRAGSGRAGSGLGDKKEHLPSAWNLLWAFWKRWTSHSWPSVPQFAPRPSKSALLSINAPVPQGIARHQASRQVHRCTQGLHGHSKTERHHDVSVIFQHIINIFQLILQ